MSRKMAICMVLFLCVTVIFSGCGGDSRADKDEGGKDWEEARKAYGMELSKNVMDMTADSQGNLWVADDRGLHLFDPEGEKMTGLEDEMKGISALCSEDGFIYGLDHAEKVLYKISGDGKIVEKNTLNIPEIEMTYKLRKQKDNLFIGAFQGLGKKALIIYDITGDSYQLADIDYIINFSTWKADEILAAAKNEGKDILGSYSITDRTWEPIEDFNTRVENVEYDSLIDEIFYTDMDNIYKIDTGGKAGLLGGFTGTGAGSSLNGFSFSTEGNNYAMYKYMKGHTIALSDKYVYTLNPKDGSLERFSINFNPDMKVINLHINSKLWINTNVERKAMLEFRKLNPEVLLNFVRYGDSEYYEKLSVKLLAGGDGIDIFYMDKSKSGSYFQRKIFTDLKDYEGIYKWFDDMIPSIREGCEYKGILAGVPVSLDVPNLSYNRKFMEASNISLDRLKAWDDIVSIAESLGRDNDGDGVYDTQVVAGSERELQKILFGQYALSAGFPEKKQIDYNTDRFKGILKLLKNVNNKKLFKEEEKLFADQQSGVQVISGKIGSNEKDGMLLKLSKFISLLINDQNSLIDLMGTDFSPNDVLPVPSMEGYCPMDVGLLVIHPGSELKDYCAQFLEILLNPDIDKREEQSSEKDNSENKSSGSESGDNIISAFSIYSLPVSRIIYKDIKYYENLDEKWFETYLSIMEKSRTAPDHSVLNESIQILEQYFAEDIDVDRAAQMINSKAGKILE